MDERWDLCGVGTASVDDLLTVEAYPEVDEKARVLESRRRYGGLVATALVAASRLGARCAFAGILTDDALGQSVLRAMADEGVDCEGALARPDGCTIHSIIVVERMRPTRTIFFSSPPDYPVGVLDVESIAGSCKVLLVDQLGLECARAAKARGVPVVADLEWPERPDCDGFLKLVDHLILSRAAAHAITGETEPERMVLSLQAAHPRACTAVTMGEQGIRFAAPGREGVGAVPALEVRVVETNGCGDVLHGAYGAAIAKGADVEEALRYGASVAGLFAGRPGGWEHIPTGAELSARRS